MSKTNVRSVSNSKSTQPPSNQRDKPACTSYVRHDKAEKARAQFMLNKQLEWESRLRRTGNSEDAGMYVNSQHIEYGARYYPDTKTFSYGQSTRPNASIFGTASLPDEELTDLQMVMEAESQPCRPNNTYKRTWPNAEAPRPNYRLCVVGANPL